MPKKIRDLKVEDIFVGLRFRSLLDYEKIGVVVKIDHDDDNYAWCKWEDGSESLGGFYGNDCDCEVVEHV